MRKKNKKCNKKYRTSHIIVRFNVVCHTFLCRYLKFVMHEMEPGQKRVFHTFTCKTSLANMQTTCRATSYRFSLILSLCKRLARQNNEPKTRKNNKKKNERKRNWFCTRGRERIDGDKLNGNMIKNREYTIWILFLLFSHFSMCVLLHDLSVSSKVLAVRRRKAIFQLTICGLWFVMLFHLRFCARIFSFRLLIAVARFISKYLIIHNMYKYFSLLSDLQSKNESVCTITA